MSIQAAHKVRMNLDALSYAHRVWESFNTPVSLSCHLLAVYGEYEQLVRKVVDASHYVRPSDFFADYQSVKLLSKYPYLDTKIDTEQAARDAFRLAEDQCRRTNVRWRMRENGVLFEPHVERVISLAQRKISLILSDVPTFENLDFGFGPGAAFGVRGETSVFNKVTADLECTYVFADKLAEFLGEFPGWIPEGTASVRLVPGSQLAFVPKDAKTDRPICIEPLLNGLYQKGVGSHIRDRLQRFGIKLRDQGVNQKLASVAHLNGLATVDFSSASDTISYRIVMDLLPFDWFEFLDVARCPNYLDGTWKTFQKFSSMGNAYTFELETLIFYALACACCEELGVSFRTGENLSVYGDDVILPRSAFDLFSEVTVACGFSLNDAKSFTDGVFFESCGHDYFQGTFVRPFLLKKRINTLLPAFYAANTLKRMAERLPSEDVFSCTPGSPAGTRSSIHGRLMDVHDWVVRRIPARFRVLGPEGYGDGHLLATLDEAVTHRQSRVSRHPCWDGWWYMSYKEEALLITLDSYPSAYALYFTMRQNSNSLFGDAITLRNGDGYTVRGRTKVSRKRSFCHSEWLGSSRRVT